MSGGIVDQELSSSCLVRLIFTQISTAVYEAMKTDTDWVLANLNMSGYYRVNYDLENWHRLITQLDANHEVSRVKRASRGIAR